MATLWKLARAVLLGNVAAVSGRDVCSDEKGSGIRGELQSPSTNSQSPSLMQRSTQKRSVAEVDEQEADTPLSDLDEMDIDPAMAGYTDPESDIDPAMTGDTDPDIDPAMAGYTDSNSDIDPAMANATNEGPNNSSAAILLESGTTCRDDPTEFHCKDLALRGHCISNRAHMAAKCPRSCCKCTDQVGTIYGIGMGNNIWKKPKCSPIDDKHWTRIGRGSVYGIQLHTGAGGGSTSQPYLYGIGLGHNIWKQPLCDMTPHTHWAHIGRGSVHQIVIHKNDLYGIAFDSRVWKQPLQHMSTGSHWQCVTPGSVRFIHVDSNTDTLYGVGMGYNVWRQYLNAMSVHTPWQHVARGSMHVIVTHGGWMYGIGMGGSIWKQLLRTMTPSSHWTRASLGAIHQIEISGGSVYGIGMGNNIWRQSLSSMSTHSHWTRNAHGSFFRILIDSHCGEKPPVGRWRFVIGHSAGQTVSESVTVQATDTRGRTLTKSESLTFGVAVSTEVNFVPGPAGGFGGSVGIEVSASTTSTIARSYSQSFSQSRSTTQTASCAARVGKCPKLWQWIIEDENSGMFAATAEYLCTYGCRAHSPECPVKHCNSHTNELCSANGCVPWGVSR